MNYLQKLTELQHKVGYKEGKINIIALFGLFGESGEVLKETVCSLGELSLQKYNATKAAEIIDKIKKEIRDSDKYEGNLLRLLDAKSFDEEMSDVLYYLNALAINRGKTIDDYAKISYDKVIKKSQQDISHGSVNKETDPLRMLVDDEQP